MDRKIKIDIVAPVRGVNMILSTYELEINSKDDRYLLIIDPPRADFWQDVIKLCREHSPKLTLNLRKNK